MKQFNDVRIYLKYLEELQLRTAIVPFLNSFEFLKHTVMQIQCIWDCLNRQNKDTDTSNITSRWKQISKRVRRISLKTQWD